jgi:hypothetical protein
VVCSCLKKFVCPPRLGPEFCREVVIRLNEEFPHKKKIEWRVRDMQIEANCNPLVLYACYHAIFLNFMSQC